MAAKNEGAVKAAPDLLKNVVKSIQKKFGDEAAIRLAGNTGVASVPYWISTGALNFDAILGGGIAGGRIVELFSRNESEGKTSVAAHVARECQKLGGYVLYADMEQTVHEAYFKTLGVDVEEQFILSRPDTWEHLCSIIETFAQGIRDAGGETCPILVVVDSVAAAQTQAQLDAEYDDRQVAEHARAVSMALRKLNPVISQTQTTLLLLNQARTKIGVMFGDPDDTPGGRALKFYASQRIILRKSKALKQEGTENDKLAPIIGIEIEANIKKNKVAAPFGKATFEFYFGQGINYPASVFDFGVSRGVFLKESPGYYSHKKYGGKFRRADFITGFYADTSLQKIHDELRKLAMEPPEFIAVTKEDESGPAQENS